MYAVSLPHAEWIITKLLESVIEQAEYPLTVNKLEGDAALFYAWAEPDPRGVARSTFQQGDGFISAFEARQDDLIANNVCDCSACKEAGRLKVKVILHYGEVALKRVQKFEELAGETVIAAHRLLKNSVQKDEYLMATADFQKVAEGIPGREGTPMQEHYAVIGSVRTTVFDPSPRDRSGPPSVSLGKKLRQLGGVVGYMMLRKLHLIGAREFPCLQGL